MKKPYTAGWKQAATDTLSNPSASNVLKGGLYSASQHLRLSAEEFLGALAGIALFPYGIFTKSKDGQSWPLNPFRKQDIAAKRKRSNLVAGLYAFTGLILSPLYVAISLLNVLRFVLLGIIDLLYAGCAGIGKFLGLFWQAERSPKDTSLAKRVKQQGWRLWALMLPLTISAIAVLDAIGSANRLLSVLNLPLSVDVGLMLTGILMASYAVARMLDGWEDIETIPPLKTPKILDVTDKQGLHTLRTLSTLLFGSRRRILTIFIPTAAMVGTIVASMFNTPIQQLIATQPLRGMLLLGLTMITLVTVSFSLNRLFAIHTKAKKATSPRARRPAQTPVPALEGRAQTPPPIHNPLAAFDPSLRPKPPTRPAPLPPTV